MMHIHNQFSQRGVVLITSLILLVLMTLLAATIIKTSVIDLKIGGANQVIAQNLATAEAEIMNYVNTENTLASPNWLSPHAPVDVTYDGNGNNISTVHIALDAGGNCTEPQDTMMASPLKVVYRRITATATGVLGGHAVINQGVRATSISCS